MAVKRASVCRSNRGIACPDCFIFQKTKVSTRIFHSILLLLLLLLLLLPVLLLLLVLIIHTPLATDATYTVFVKVPFLAEALTWQLWAYYHSYHIKADTQLSVASQSDTTTASSTSLKQGAPNSFPRE